MEERNIKISLEKAKEWYDYGDNSLKEVALQAFTEEELTKFDYHDIKTFDDAFKYLCNNDMCDDLTDEYTSAITDSYSEILCKYRIIVAALTNNEERKLNTGDCWFPVVQFCEIGKETNCRGRKRIGTIKHNEKKYVVVGGCVTNGTGAGLGDLYSNDSVSNSYARVGFRSVSSKEIAKYISEQFGRLLFEVQYGGVNCDWKWID